MDSTVSLRSVATRCHRITAAVALVFSVAVGCVDTPPRDQAIRLVTGEYRVAPRGRAAQPPDRVILCPDLTYVHELDAGDGSRRQTGRWQLHLKHGGRAWVGLQGYEDYTAIEGYPAGVAAAGSPFLDFVGPTTPVPYLVFNSDLNHLLVRVGNESVGSVPPECTGHARER